MTSGVYEWNPPLLHTVAARGDFVDKIYSIFFDNAKVGTVTVEIQGLYCCVHCCCCLPKDKIYIVWVRNNEQREKLGVCVPSENGFQLDTKIPIKRLPKGDLSFYIEPKETDRKDTIVPLAPNEPFGYLAELRNASFIMEDDQPALSIKSCHRSEEGFECP